MNDFESITLTRKELRRLKSLAKAPNGLPRAPEDGTLFNNDLIECPRFGAPPHPYFISVRGKEYLAYLGHRKKDKSSDRRHDWVIAIFSVIVGAVLSRPLWQIIDWLAGLLSLRP